MPRDGCSLARYADEHTQQALHQQCREEGSNLQVACSKEFLAPSALPTRTPAFEASAFTNFAISTGGPLLVSRRDQTPESSPSGTHNRIYVAWTSARRISASPGAKRIAACCE